MFILFCRGYYIKDGTEMLIYEKHAEISAAIPGRILSLRDHERPRQHSDINIESSGSTGNFYIATDDWA